MHNVRILHHIQVLFLLPFLRLPFSYSTLLHQSFEFWLNRPNFYLGLSKFWGQNTLTVYINDVRCPGCKFVYNKLFIPLKILFAPPFVSTRGRFIIIVPPNNRYILSFFFTEDK